MILLSLKDARVPRYAAPMALTKVARLLRKHDSWAEQLLWTWLRDRRFSNYKFRRQHPFGPFVLDCFCLEARLNIELDGFQHGSPEHRANDMQRDQWLELRGVKVLRFWSSHLRRDKEMIRNAIGQALQERAPQTVPAYGQTSGTPQDLGSIEANRSD